MSCHGDPMYDRMMAGLAQNMGGPGGSDSAAFIQESFTEQEKTNFLQSMSGQIELLHKQKETLGAMGERDLEPVKIAERRKVAERARDVAWRRAIDQSQGLRVEQQQAAHQNFHLSQQSDMLETLKKEYKVHCLLPGGHASRVGTNFEVT